MSKVGKYTVANKEEEVSWADKMGEQKTGYVRGWLALQVGQSLDSGPETTAAGDKG